MIRFTEHAREKIWILRRHSFEISEKDVLDVINNPDIIDYSRLPLLIAQKDMDKSHVLRVVYKIKDNVKIIITFYPGRKKQYGEE